MKNIIAVAGIVLALASSSAHAQERAGSAAIGAVSGAVVLGPIGAVAGAVIGFTAGPAIARSWSGQRHEPRPRARVAKRPPQVVTRQASQNSNSAAPGVVTPQAAPGVVTPQAPPAAVTPQTGGLGGPAAQGFE
jgi:hypothetical protein